MRWSTSCAPRASGWCSPGGSTTRRLGRRAAAQPAVGEATAPCGRGAVAAPVRDGRRAAVGPGLSWPGRYVLFPRAAHPCPRPVRRVCDRRRCLAGRVHGGDGSGSGASPGTASPSLSAVAATSSVPATSTSTSTSASAKPTKVPVARSPLSGGSASRTARSWWSSWTNAQLRAARGSRGRGRRLSRAGGGRPHPLCRRVLQSGPDEHRADPERPDLGPGPLRAVRQGRLRLLRGAAPPAPGDRRGQPLQRQRGQRPVRIST